MEFSFREKRNVYSIYVVKPEGKSQLGRTRHRNLHNIEIDVREIGCGGTDWIYVAHVRDHWLVLAHTTMNLQVAQYFNKFLSSCFSSRSQIYIQLVICTHVNVIFVVLYKIYCSTYN
jgi:hypothetical protein